MVLYGTREMKLESYLFGNEKLCPRGRRQETRRPGSSFQKLNCLTIRVIWLSLLQMHFKQWHKAEKDQQID